MRFEKSRRRQVLLLVRHQATGGALSPSGCGAKVRRAPVGQACGTRRPCRAVRSCRRACVRTGVRLHSARRFRWCRPPRCRRVRGGGEPSLKELAQDTASTVVHAATSLHNINVQGKCLLWGALYTIGGFSIFFSGDAASDEKLPLLLLIVYGIWLLVGGFTGGWRLVIY